MTMTQKTQQQQQIRKVKSVKELKALPYGTEVANEYGDLMTVHTYGLAYDDFQISYFDEITEDFPLYVTGN